jgi:hypothetical protein
VWSVPFQIRNSGTRRLIINEIDATCGCGDPVRVTHIIPPGDGIEVNLSLDTRTATGSVEEVASYTTSDPAHPRFELVVRAWVEADRLSVDADLERLNSTSDQVSIVLRRSADQKPARAEGMD